MLDDVAWSLIWFKLHATSGNKNTNPWYLGRYAPLTKVIFREVNQSQCLCTSEAAWAAAKRDPHVPPKFRALAPAHRLSLAKPKVERSLARGRTKVMLGHRSRQTAPRGTDQNGELQVSQHERKGSEPLVRGGFVEWLRVWWRTASSRVYPASSEDHPGEVAGFAVRWAQQTYNVSVHFDRRDSKPRSQRWVRWIWWSLGWLGNPGFRATFSPRKRIDSGRRTEHSWPFDYGRSVG